MEDNKIPAIEVTEELNDSTMAEATEETTEKSELEKLQSDLVEQKDKFLRLSAEFDNYKRRTSKERMELIQTAGKEIIISLLGILDDCERAEKQLKNAEDLQVIIDGDLLIFNKLRSLLQQKGLTSMETIHTDFDVEKHEAITKIDCEEALKGKVVDELEKGYYLNNKLIRFAKVVVGN